MKGVKLVYNSVLAFVDVLVQLYEEQVPFKKIKWNNKVLVRELCTYSIFQHYRLSYLKNDFCEHLRKESKFFSNFLEIECKWRRVEIVMLKKLFFYIIFVNIEHTHTQTQQMLH